MYSCEPGTYWTFWYEDNDAFLVIFEKHISYRYDPLQMPKTHPMTSSPRIQQFPLQLSLRPSRSSLTFQRAGVGVEAHQLDGFVVAAGSDEVSHGTPGHAVDGALVVPGPLQHHRRLVRHVIVSATVVSGGKVTMK